MGYFIPRTEVRFDGDFGGLLRRRGKPRWDLDIRDRSGSINQSCFFITNPPLNDKSVVVNEVAGSIELKVTRTAVFVGISAIGTDDKETIPLDRNVGIFVGILDRLS